MDQLKQRALQFEETLDRLASPLKPHLPLLARFLLVVTFLEDSVRILMQWSDQMSYMTIYRGFPSFISFIFLAGNIVAMTICSCLVLAKKSVKNAVYGLGAVVLSQAIGYGMLTDLNFMLRNLSLVGGLVLLLSDWYTQENKQAAMFPGLPDLNRAGVSTYLTLAGRVMLVFLFFGLAFGGGGEFGLVRFGLALFALAVCIMVIVGFKAKYSAIFLVGLLSLFNVAVNNWWSLHHEHPKRDFMKYDFFQTLSVMGGLLLLVNIGPGGLSIDEKKKQF